MASIHVDIVSAEGAIFSGEAAMVFAPAKMGEIGIAPRHAPLLTDLKPGEVRIQTSDGEEQRFYVTGGILEVQPHLVTVLADSAMHADQLDEDAALRLASAPRKSSKAGMARSILHRLRPSWWKRRPVIARLKSSEASGAEAVSTRGRLPVADRDPAHTQPARY